MKRKRKKKGQYVYFICYEQDETYARYPRRGSTEIIFPTRITRIEQIREIEKMLQSQLCDDMHYRIYNFKFLRKERDSESSEN